ncbi:MAG: hypothetical protein ACOYL8_05080 [Patescibacteria group bacterium]
MEKTTAWFIEPKDSHTNEIIARRLAEVNEIADSTNQIIEDDKGIEHSVYQVKNHQRILEFCKSKNQFQLKFKVFTRPVIDGPLKESVIDSEEFKRAKKQKKITQITFGRIRL